MSLLEFATLIVTGFVSCAEFGSYAFMTLTLVLAIAFASDGAGTAAWSWLAAAAFAASLVSTIVVNVPINLATRRWDAEHPPADWQRDRSRWEVFQGVRSWLLLTGFILICVASTT